MVNGGERAFMGGRGERYDAGRGSRYAPTWTAAAAEGARAALRAQGLQLGPAGLLDLADSAECEQGWLRHLRAVKMVEADREVARAVVGHNVRRMREVRSAVLAEKIAQSACRQMRHATTGARAVVDVKVTTHLDCGRRSFVEWRSRPGEADRRRDTRASGAMLARHARWGLRSEAPAVVVPERARERVNNKRESKAVGKLSAAATGLGP